MHLCSHVRTCVYVGMNKCMYAWPDGCLHGCMPVHVRMCVNIPGVDVDGWPIAIQFADSKLTGIVLVLDRDPKPCKKEIVLNESSWLTCSASDAGVHFTVCFQFFSCRARTSSFWCATGKLEPERKHFPMGQAAADKVRLEPPCPWDTHYQFE